VPIGGTVVVDAVVDAVLVVDVVSVVDAVLVVDAVSVVDAVTVDALAVVYVELDPKALSIDDDSSAVPGMELMVPLVSCRACKCLWSKRNSSR
jgi:hypothetical protein